MNRSSSVGEAASAWRAPREPDLRQSRVVLSDSGRGWLPRQDLNLKSLIQSQMCCHYTTGQGADRVPDRRGRAAEDPQSRPSTTIGAGSGFPSGTNRIEIELTQWRVFLRVKPSPKKTWPRCPL